jgi:hypothetical protein
LQIKWDYKKKLTNVTCGQNSEYVAGDIHTVTTICQKVNVIGLITMQTEVSSERTHKPEEELHAASKCLKVNHVIQRTLLPYMPKHRHANDGIYEGYEGQQCTNIEESWQGDHQCEQQLPNAFSCLYSPTVCVNDRWAPISQTNHKINVHKYLIRIN